MQNSWKLGAESGETEGRGTESLGGGAVPSCTVALCLILHTRAVKHRAYRDDSGVPSSVAKDDLGPIAPIRRLAISVPAIR